jgi:hypothetical protein
MFVFVCTAFMRAGIAAWKNVPSPICDGVYTDLTHTLANAKARPIQK